MANSDYVTRDATFGFCPYATIASPIARSVGPTVVMISGLNSSVPNPIVVGRAALVNDEIVRINAVSGTSVTLGRGCCDTVPQAHPANSIIWFFDGSTARDSVEYAPTETVAVKPRPFTSQAIVPVESAPPLDVTMNWRFARPYPPGLLQIDGQPFTAAASVSTANPVMNITWGNRNRITQADTLLDHLASNVTPEAGQTTRIRFYRASDNVLVRTESGLTGTSYDYPVATARSDFGVTSTAVNGYAIVDSQRQFGNVQVIFRVANPYNNATGWGVNGIYGGGAYTFPSLQAAFTWAGNAYAAALGFGTVLSSTGPIIAGGGPPITSENIGAHIVPTFSPPSATIGIGVIVQDDGMLNSWQSYRVDFTVLPP